MDPATLAPHPATQAAAPPATSAASACPRCGVPLLPGATTCLACGNLLAAAGPAAKYAGFWLRVLAAMIDTVVTFAGFVLLFLLLLLGVSFVLGVTGRGDVDAERLAEELTLPFQFIGVIAGWLYYALLESSSWQATLGKRALGLTVTHLNGRRISFGRATGRYFGKIISGLLLGVGYLMAGFTARKQALHDMMADCLVIRRS